MSTHVRSSMFIIYVSEFFFLSQDISDTLEKFGTQKIVNDKFQDVMGVSFYMLFILHSIHV